jgi:predicted phosphodiesterase
MPGRIAVVSDVHGNTTAFEAVLADIEARGISRIINLGDVVGKGPRGSEAIALTRAHCEVTVRGNWDTFIARDETQLWPAAQWTHDELSADDRAWLLALPNTHDLVMSGQHVRFFHASQVHEFHRVNYHHTEEEFRGMFTNTDFTGHGPTPTVVGYGDIHGTYLEVDLGLTLFNAGSVGNPLDAPGAPYVVLEGDTDSGLAAPEPAGTVGPSITFVRVPYDVEAEIAVARELGMPDVEAYALELREQVYRGSAVPPPS